MFKFFLDQSYKAINPYFRISQQTTVNNAHWLWDQKEHNAAVKLMEQAIFNDPSNKGLRGQYGRWKGEIEMQGKAAKAENITKKL